MAQKALVLHLLCRGKLHRNEDSSARIEIPEGSTIGGRGGIVLALQRLMANALPLPASAAPRKGTWRILRGWLVGAAILLGLVVLIPLVLLRPQPVEVRVVRIERGLVEETVTSTKAGSIRSRQLSPVSVDIAGTITHIHTRQGTRVKKGEHLVSIDRRDADAALAGAERELAVLEAYVGEARAKRDDALRERERYRDLRRTDSASQFQLDQTETSAEMASAAADAALARSQAQRATVERARISADKCDLHAPFDGIVAELYVEVGEWALPGKVVMKILDPDRLYVRAELDEVDLAGVRVGLPARVTLDPYRDKRLTGKVVRVAPYVSEVQEQNRTLEIEVELESGIAGLDLKHGTSADVELILRDVKDVLRVPSQALLEGNRVLVATPDGVARAVPLRLGMKNWEYAQVLGGLSGGEQVIVSLESEKVKDGVRIRVLP
jgi:HlyD family secretion protein